VARGPLLVYPCPRAMLWPKILNNIYILQHMEIRSDQHSSYQGLSSILCSVVDLRLGLPEAWLKIGVL